MPKPLILRSAVGKCSVVELLVHRPPLIELLLLSGGRIQPECSASSYNHDVYYSSVGMPKSTLRRGSHSVFNIQLHIVFVTKYRRKVITAPMIERLREIFAKICIGQKCILVSFNGEADHVHLLVDTHPDNNIAAFIGSMKAASSRLLRKEFADIVQKTYWKSVFWSDSYCCISSGGAPLEVLKKYIQDQDSPLV